MGRLRAFTLIEMLVVIVIITILAGMSLPGILSIVGKTKLRKSAEAIVIACREARQYARNRCGDGMLAYGVCLAVDGNGRYYATVIQGGPGDGKSTNAAREVLTPAGTPALRRYLPAGAEIWLGSQSLAAGATNELAWFFESRTGRPAALQGGAFSSGAIAVGFTPAVVSSGKINGAWGVSGYNVAMTVLAPDQGTDPGLSVRSGKSRIALHLYPTGFINVVEP